MKKALIIFAAMAIFVSGTAQAAVPMGFVAGASYVNTSVGIASIQTLTPIRDGEQVNVGKNNDTSGDCDGDIGTVFVRYTDESTATISILCAHWTGKNSMMFDFFDAKNNTYDVFRAIDKGHLVDSTLFDHYGSSEGDSGYLARQVVNLGTDGAGVPNLTLVANQTADWTVGA